MNPLLRNSLAAVLLFSVMIPVAAADGPATPAPAMPADLSRQVREITDAVLEHHVDPPARQQMIVDGIRALYREAHQPIPYGLGRRASEVVAPEQLAAMLAELWPKTTAGKVTADRLEEALLDGLLEAVPGRAFRMSAKEARVEEQMAGNRYVGIHVALSWLEDQKLPTFHEVFPGGPADRAGIRKDDLLLEVEGVATKGLDLRRVVERLRGDEGTDVTVKVRGPKEEKVRTLTMTRGQLPRATIEGLRKQTSGEWEFRLDGPDPIGYLKVKEIAASTPHELRKLARQMEDQGLRALVLDLRSHQSRGDVHPAALLADSLLESGTIGRVRTARGETTYPADADALFRGWPIAVLVDQTTAGTMEWVAAALQDNHRAAIVGSPTRGRMPRRPGPALDEAEVRSSVPVGDGRWVISMMTGYLERGDGRLLADRSGPSSIRRPPTGGVVPDHPVAEPRGRDAATEPIPLRRPDARSYGAAEPDPRTRTPAVDPALQAARTALRKAMEAH